MDYIQYISKHGWKNLKVKNPLEYQLRRKTHPHLQVTEINDLF